MEQNLNGHNEKSLLRVDMQPSSRYIWTLKTEVFDRCFWRDISAELVATFLLVNMQCLAAADWHTDVGSFNVSSSHAWSSSAVSRHDTASHSDLPMFKAALCNWLAMTSLVWIFWKYGGGLMNPAVTLGFALTARITFHKAIWFMLAQWLGALAAVFFVKLLVPASIKDWSVLPQPHAELGLARCYVIEAVITCQLVLAYISTTHLLDKESRILCCVAVGMSAAIGTLYAYSSTSACMNPARYIAALASSSTTTTIHRHTTAATYIVGELTGAVMATVICYVMWCGYSGQPHLPSFNSLQSSSSRTGLRLKPRLVQYLGISRRPLHDDVHRLSPGGPPLCYFCAESMPSSANRDKALV